jgi:Ca-activated chloride channel family protein
MSRQQIIAIIFAVLGTLVASAIWLYFRESYSFKSPEWFYLLISIPLAGVYHVWSSSRRFPKVQLPALKQFPINGAQFNEIVVQLPFLLRSAALTFMFIALARPQSQTSWQNVTTEGIDIVIAMDISTSMLAQDFKPNRLESSKEVATRFIKGRPNDRIGLVVYEGESFTQCPLTTDHQVLINLFKDIKSGLVQGGTAIGLGLANAVNRLRESEAKSKVVILMTDGENNAGAIAPITAAEIAQSYGVRVYTIGVGTRGRAMSPVAMYPDGRYKYELVDVKIDDKLMEEIAKMTGGSYYRATDNDALRRIFTEIDELERSKINVTEHSRRAEKYYWFAAIASILFMAEFVLKYLFLRTSP